MAPTTLSFPEPIHGLGVDTSDTGCFVTLDTALPIEIEIGERKTRGAIVATTTKTGGVVDRMSEY